MSNAFTAGDNYSYDPDTGAVAAGSDGVMELNIYPGGGAAQLPPGNFGTVDIGSSNNSTADLSRQIRYGVNENDLSYFGGELRLGEDGTSKIKFHRRVGRSILAPFSIRACNDHVSRSDPPQSPLGKGGGLPRQKTTLRKSLKLARQVGFGRPWSKINANIAG